jgi:hypothetical protein
VCAESMSREVKIGSVLGIYGSKIKKIFLMVRLPATKVRCRDPLSVIDCWTLVDWSTLTGLEDH